jgi:hypothetical protein
LVNCTYTDVRDIIDTGLTDARLTALIVLADAEIQARNLQGEGWTSGVKKQVSMLITASLAAMNDVRSLGKADYQAGEQNLSEKYRKAAELIIDKMQGPADVAGKPRARTG